MYLIHLKSTVFLEVEIYAAEATCPRCGNISRNPHQNHWLRVRDLPMSNRAVWLKVNRRQFKASTKGSKYVLLKAESELNENQK
ncbi:MAG TPA: transposase family protein [Leptolyngbyaceae cyanobacterium]